MGRVKQAIHEIPMLKRFKHQFFEMSYLYDAVSGKVREMIYNKGRKDEFWHRFAYDAMGNLKYVWTSRDGKHWTLESALKYYPDGKLMRREIRPKDLMLQGLDYAYTLDGWLKAINSEVLENDPSKDGISGTYQYFARDVFSLLLRYYPNDYRPIKPTATPLEATITSGYSHLYKPYYTGWISSWSLNLDTLHTAYSFRYDRLGRLTKATTLEGFDGTEWNASLIKNYSTKYSYDLVGNILGLTRYGSDTNAIDVLTYEYYNRSRNNRLKRIIDGAGQMIGIDLETQPIDNYGYDPVGNMVKDSSRNMRVFYTYSNKPKRIRIGNRTIKMYYNPSGYRFFKGKGPNKGQIFVYNSQGQLMAKYTINGRKLQLDFMPIYEGTKRLGIIEPEGVEWYAKRKCYAKNPLTGEEIEVPCGGEFDVGDAPMLRVMPRGEGRVLKPSRKYELTDHLGNVRVVIMDQRVPVSTDGSTVAYYKPLISEISDYYPYGWQKVLGKYEFGANAGSLFEDWDSTRGTYYTLYRLLDARIARWYQVEPLWESYAWMSPYVVNGGDPIIYVDLLGDTIIVSDNAKELYNRLIATAKSKYEFYMTKYREFKAKGKEKRAENMLYKANQYKEVLEEIKVLEESAELFYIMYSEKGSPDGRKGGSFKYRGGRIFTITIYATTSDDFSDLQKLAHELKHAYQFKEGKLGFVYNELANDYEPWAYDVYDEIEAYERGNLFYSYLEGQYVDDVYDFAKKEYPDLPKFECNIVLSEEEIKRKNEINEKYIREKFYPKWVAEGLKYY